MLDPLLIFLELFGGPLIGLIEGLVRKRGLLGTLVNIIVAGTFGIGAAIAVGILANPDWKSAGILLYVAPIVSSFVGVFVVLGILRRERWSTIGELFKVAASFVLVTLLLLGLSNIYFRFFVGSVQYTLVRAAVPATTLAGREMAGADKVTIVVSTPLPGSGTLNTASAADILAAIPTASIGQPYRLRIINKSSSFTWMAVAGSSVTLQGARTIDPNAWRDFSVTTTGPTTVLIQSTNAGVCPKEYDAYRCRL